MHSSKASWKLRNLEAEISLSYKTSREAEAVAEAVSPDNVRVPEGLTIRTFKQGKKVLTRLKCRTSMSTFISTIDDLLSAVSVAERSVSAVKKPVATTSLSKA